MPCAIEGAGDRWQVEGQRVILADGEFSAQGRKHAANSRSGRMR
jgi:hypothetical protein